MIKRIVKNPPRYKGEPESRLAKDEAETCTIHSARGCQRFLVQVFRYVLPFEWQVTKQSRF